MNEYADQLPEEITVHTYESQADNVNSIFDSLYVSLLLAVIAVLIITTSGLTLFGSFDVALTVLVSVLIGFISIPYLCVVLYKISFFVLLLVILIYVYYCIIV